MRHLDHPPDLQWSLLNLSGAFLWDALKRAARVQDPELVPLLAGHAVGADVEGRLQARRALAATLEWLPGGALLRLDRFCRAHLPPLRVEEMHRRLSPQDAEDGWAIAAAFSWHRDGYVRERATAWLAGERSGVEVPFLLLRMDWVKPIQRLAREAMEERLRPAMAGPMISALPMLRRLAGWGRADHSGFLARARAYLLRPDLASARDRGLAAADPQVRRLVFELVLEAEPERGADLVCRAAADPARSVRRWGMGLARRRPGLANRRALEAFLLDPELVHRQEAQRLARRMDPPLDLAAFYRAALAEERPGRAVLFGLGETGAHEDVARVLPFLEHPRTAIRRAAVYALAWLDAEGQAVVLAQQVGSPRPRVSNDAANTLVRHAHLVAGDCLAQIESILGAAPEQHQQDNARRVLATGQAYQRRWGSEETRGEG